MDKLFCINTIAATPNPQQVVYQALHQCYSPNFVCDEPLPSEKKCGEIIVNRLLAGNRGHFSPLETVNITLGCGFFSHSLVQQITRHRHLSFSVQSFRYTGSQVVEVAEGTRSYESVFYLRPVGDYSDRAGGNYTYSQEQRSQDIAVCIESATRYALWIKRGVSEEHARGILLADYRQNFVMSCNARSLMHLLDMRSSTVAQVECQWFCELLMERFVEWMPQVSEWYLKNRYKKCKLAP